MSLDILRLKGTRTNRLSLEFLVNYATARVEAHKRELLRAPRSILIGRRPWVWAPHQKAQAIARVCGSDGATRPEIVRELDCSPRWARRLIKKLTAANRLREEGGVYFDNTKKA
jgi:hypothetical protein